MTILGTLKVLGLYDGAKFNKGVDKSKRKTKELKGSLNKLETATKNYTSSLSALVAGGIAGIGATGLGALIHRTALAEVHTARFANTLGLSAGQLSGFHRAAKQFNIQQDVMNDALLELSKRASEATTGTGSMFDALNILNINVDRFSRMRLHEQFDLVTKSLAKLGTSQRNFLTDEIFGGAADHISGLTTQINDLAKAYGNVDKSADSKNAREFLDSYNQLADKLTQVGKGLVIDVTPAALDAVQGLTILLESTGIIKPTDNAAKREAEKRARGGGTIASRLLSGFLGQTLGDLATGGLTNLPSRRPGAIQALGEMGAPFLQTRQDRINTISSDETIRRRQMAAANGQPVYAQPGELQ